MSQYMILLDISHLEPWLHTHTPTHTNSDQYMRLLDISHLNSLNGALVTHTDTYTHKVVS